MIPRFSTGDRAFSGIAHELSSQTNEQREVYNTLYVLDKPRRTFVHNKQSMQDMVLWSMGTISFFADRAEELRIAWKLLKQNEWMSTSLRSGTQALNLYRRGDYLHGCVSTCALRLERDLAVTTFVWANLFLIMNEMLDTNRGQFSVFVPNISTELSQKDLAKATNIHSTQKTLQREWKVDCPDSFERMIGRSKGLFDRVNNGGCTLKAIDSQLGDSNWAELVRAYRNAHNSQAS